MKRMSLPNRFLCGLIILSCTLTIIETEPTVHAGREMWFEVTEGIIAGIFLVEYALRLWICVERPGFRHPVGGRLRYLVTPQSLLDLLALLPALVLISGSEAFLLRIFRLVRILRLARLGQFSRSAKLLVAALRARRFELYVTVSTAFLLLILSSTLMFLVEKDAQPDQFGSIPRAMWWSVVTLTTVGYGDVYPSTPLGKVLAGLTAIIGIGLIAMPTGIITAAFSDLIHQHRKEREGGGEG